MQKNTLPIQIITAAIVSISLFPAPAAAYLGPGAGISAVGSAIALFAAIFVAIIGFLWYPIKRIMRKKNQLPATEPDVDAESVMNIELQKIVKTEQSTK